MNSLSNDSFSNTPPCASHSLVVRLRIALHHCLSFVLSWLFRTLSPPPSFPFALHYLVLCVLFFIIAHRNVRSISLKTPKDNLYFLNSTSRDVWQRREGNREWKGKWESERVAMRKVFRSIGRGYTSYAPLSSCTYLQNELNKKSPTPLLWLCTQVQSV